MYMLQSTKLAEKLPRAPSRRSSQNSQQAKFSERPTGVLPRILLPESV
jgi:hypothetical protein